MTGEEMNKVLYNKTQIKTQYHNILYINSKKTINLIGN